MKIRTLTVIALVAMAGVASASLLVPNGDFETPDGALWAQDGAVWGGFGTVDITFPATGGSGDNGGYGQLAITGETWAVLVSPDVPGASGGGVLVGDLGVTPGTLTTFTMDMINIVGTSPGKLKVEAWAANAIIGNSGDMAASAVSSSWDTYTFDWTVPAGTEKLIFVPVAGADSTIGFDNVGVIPEPASIALIGVFGGGLLFFRRHFKI